jgi:hypothetical protein
MSRPSDDVRRRIQTEPDYIYLPRCNCSVQHLIRRHPDGVPTHTIAQALLLTEAEVEALYEEIVLKLRALMRAEQ